MAKQDYIKVIDCLKNKNNTISDLENLFKNGTIADDDIPKGSTIGYLDNVFQFTYRALDDKAFKTNYYTFRKTKLSTNNIYRNACKHINGTVSDRTIFDSWKEYLTEKSLTFTPDTSLRQLLENILHFVEEKYPNAEGFIGFLTELQNGTSAANTSLPSAMGKIEHAIEASAKSKKCVIFTGAPGTGKTYCVEEYVNKRMQGFESGYFVQFHSSYDYTDFVEGLRPVQEKDEKGGMNFVRMDGIFKAFCREVVRLNKQNINPPPSGSPESGDGGEEHPKEKMYYFVIDEINRADLGRVFGELMYCFEKRGEEHQIATQYANLPACEKDGEEIEDDYFAHRFYIPENVVIIGTMNDIDRSVETFDFALRRRFDWVEIEADEVMESSLQSMGVPTDMVPQIKAMNGIIKNQSGLGKEFKIGPAYFKDYDGSNLADIWEHNIAPILREYMRGRQGSKDFIDKCYEALLTETGTQ